MILLAVVFGPVLLLGLWFFPIETILVAVFMLALVLASSWTFQKVLGKAYGRKFRAKSPPITSKPPP